MENNTNLDQLKLSLKRRAVDDLEGVIIELTEIVQTKSPFYDDILNLYGRFKDSKENMNPEEPKEKKDPDWDRKVRLGLVLNNSGNDPEKKMIIKTRIRFACISLIENLSKDDLKESRN